MPMEATDRPAAQTITISFQSITTKNIYRLCVGAADDDARLWSVPSGLSFQGMNTFALGSYIGSLPGLSGSTAGP